MKSSMSRKSRMSTTEVEEGKLTTMLYRLLVCAIGGRAPFPRGGVFAMEEEEAFLENDACDCDSEGLLKCPTRFEIDDFLSGGSPLPSFEFPLLEPESVVGGSLFALARERRRRSVKNEGILTEPQGCAQDV